MVKLLVGMRLYIIIVAQVLAFEHLLILQRLSVVYFTHCWLSFWLSCPMRASS